MRSELKNKIVEENHFYKLLQQNSQYRLQGWSKTKNKVAVGIIKGNPEDYKEWRDHLDFKYYDSWKEAYQELGY